MTVTWDLRELVYDPEEIETSEEARRLIQLRDDVLDEINQLYFQRRRVLNQLSVAPSGSAEVSRLRLRAQELAAGLDAWTDGWFGRGSASRCGRD